MYNLVSGLLPFDGEDDDQIFRKIRAAKFSFDHKEFDTISDECKDLITKLLEIRPKRRYTA